MFDKNPGNRCKQVKKVQVYQLQAVTEFIAEIAWGDLDDFLEAGEFLTIFFQHLGKSIEKPAIIARKLGNHV
jgi:hypothetical protein